MTESLIKFLEQSRDSHVISGVSRCDAEEKAQYNLAIAKLLKAEELAEAADDTLSSEGRELKALSRKLYNYRKAGEAE